MNVASGGVAAGGLEQVERAVGVDPEVGLRIGGRPVVRGLGRGVDDELELRAGLGEGAVDGVGVPDVDLQRAERVGELAREPLGGVPRSTRSARRIASACRSRGRSRRSPARTKWPTDSEPISPPEPVTIAVGMALRLAVRAARAAERARRGLQRAPQGLLVLGDPGRECRPGSPAAPAGAASRSARTAGVQSEMYTGTSPGRSVPSAVTSSCRPVISAHSAVVSRSDRLHLAAAADVDEGAVPARRV